MDIEMDIKKGIEKIVTSNRFYDRWKGFSVDVIDNLNNTNLAIKMTLLNMDYYDKKIDDDIYLYFRNNLIKYQKEAISLLNTSIFDNEDDIINLKIKYNNFLRNDLIKYKFKD